MCGRGGEFTALWIFLCLPPWLWGARDAVSHAGWIFFFFNMMEDYKHGALKKLQNHVHTVPRRWGRGDRGRAGHQGRGQSFPAGCRMRRGEQLYLVIKCVGLRGGDGRRDFFIIIIISFFGVGRIIWQPAWKPRRRRGRRRSACDY